MCGQTSFLNLLDSCILIDTKDNQKKEVGRMSEDDASCTVFEGRVVISGGMIHARVNTVEVYGHVTCQPQ